MSNICQRCYDEHRFCFRGLHIGPQDYLEGDPDECDVWIVALNPKPHSVGKKCSHGFVEYRSKNDMLNHTYSEETYVTNFKKVSLLLYNGMRNKKVMHTDLVKCFSKNYIEIKNGMINNCKEYLFNHIEKYKPKIVICNGSDVCKTIVDKYPPQMKGKNISYYYEFDDKSRCYFLLTGFIGRLDDYNKRRIGVEFLSLFNEAGLDRKEFIG